MPTNKYYGVSAATRRRPTSHDFVTHNFKLLSTSIPFLLIRTTMKMVEMKMDEIIALLSDISKRNNLGTRALRDGTIMMNHDRDGGSLLFIDSAITDFSVAVSTVRAALKSISINDGSSSSHDHNDNSIYMPSASVSWRSAHATGGNEQVSSHCDRSTSSRSGRLVLANGFLPVIAKSLPQQKPNPTRHDASTRKSKPVLLVHDDPTPLPVPLLTMDQASQSQVPGSTTSLSNEDLRQRSPIVLPLPDLRNAPLHDIIHTVHDCIPSQTCFLSQEIAYVYEDSITMDPLEVRKWLASIVSSTRLRARKGETDKEEGSDPPGVHTEPLVAILRHVLVRMSVMIVYNLGLAYHLKSIRERAELLRSLSSSSASRMMDTSSRSASFRTSLKNAQFFYSMSSRHITHLPSWKFKLALLNNLGHVYWERNLRDNSRQCFEAVCRHITKVSYQCSRSSVLIPFSSVPDRETLHDDSNDSGMEGLLQALMVAALLKLLAKPHAAVA